MKQIIGWIERNQAIGIEERLEALNMDFTMEATPIWALEQEPMLCKDCFALQGCSVEEQALVGTTAVIYIQGGSANERN